MKKKVLTPSLGVVLFASNVVNAAVPVSLQTISGDQLQHMFQIDREGEALSAKTSVNSLREVSSRTDENDVSHVRFQQQYLNYPVFGGYGIVHSRSASKHLFQTQEKVVMTGTVMWKLAEELGKPDPSYLLDQDRALQQFKQLYPDKDSVVEETIEPIVYVDENFHAFWAYKVSLVRDRVDGVPEHPVAILNAKDFKIWVQWDNVKSHRHSVSGLGYGGNARTGVYQFGLDLPHLEMTRDDETGFCSLENKYVKVFNMNRSYDTPKSPMQFECTSSGDSASSIYWTGEQMDGYDITNEAYSPSNDALYVGGVIHKMYRDWYGLNVLMKNKKIMPLIMRVHYGRRYENAFWDGTQMTFGDGDTLMYPLVSLSVGAHEVSHGFTEQHSDLNYVGQSGGINESFSDMAAQAVELYSKGTCSWSIGADVLKESSGLNVLRYMDQPSRDGRSIDDALSYRKGMDVHYSSGVFNRLFYRLANRPGWGVRTAFHVMLKANMDYWTPYSNFEEGACGILQSARDLKLSEADVRLVLDEVKIVHQNCLPS